MYGKRRVVLSGRHLVSVKGEKTSMPLGFWRYEDGRYYVDLKSAEQLYQLVNRDTIANRNLGGLATQKALRVFVMDYYDDMRR